MPPTMPPTMPPADITALAVVVREGFVVVAVALVAILLLVAGVAALLVRAIARQGEALRATCAAGFDRIVKRHDETDRTAGEAHQAAVRASARVEQIQAHLGIGMGRGSRPDFGTPPPSRPSGPGVLMARAEGFDADYPRK